MGDEKKSISAEAVPTAKQGTKIKIIEDGEAQGGNRSSL